MLATRREVGGEKGRGETARGVVVRRAATRKDSSKRQGLDEAHLLGTHGLVIIIQCAIMPKTTVMYSIKLAVSSNGNFGWASSMERSMRPLSLAQRSRLVNLFAGVGIYTVCRWSC